MLLLPKLICNIIFLIAGTIIKIPVQFCTFNHILYLHILINVPNFTSIISIRIVKTLYTRRHFAALMTRVDYAVNDPLRSIQIDTKQTSNNGATESMLRYLCIIALVASLTHVDSTRNVVVCKG